MKNIILVFILFFLSACVNGRIETIHTVQNTPDIKMSFIKSKVKDFDIKMQDQEKVLVLNFFAPSCGACKEEFPSLNKIATKYTKDVKILGILGEKISNKGAIDFIKKYKIHYDVVANSNEVQLFSNAVGDVFGIPVTYIFDKKGLLKYKFLGYVPHNTLKKAILQII